MKSAAAHPVASQLTSCLRNRPEVVCAYLFGSSLEEPRRAGDVDVAVLLDETLTGGDILPAITELFDALKNAPGRSDIDVVPHLQGITGRFEAICRRDTS